MNRAMAGDGRAAGLLFDRYSRVSYGLALAMLGDETEAQHVVSESFAELWREAAYGVPADAGTVEAAISMIVRRRALRSQRTRRSDPVRGELQQSSGGPQGTAGRFTSPGSSRDVVVGVLEGLPLMQRRALELAYFRGLAIREIATEIREPEQVVISYLRSAMDALKRASAMQAHSHAAAGR